jgi:hypothetical protein
MTKTPIRLSQSQLQLLEICPPQFQRLYLEQLGSAIAPENQEKLTWGSHFHRLMQQRELGLSVENLGDRHSDLSRSLTALIEAVPELKTPPLEQWRDAEHYRNLQINHYLFTVIYDLLMTDSKKAQILDWKTYLQPQNPQKLIQHWQTKLYLYVLAETSDYLPEQISMTYWFVKLPKKPQSLAIAYDSKQHQQNHRQLSDLLNQLDQWLELYYLQQKPLPHLNSCSPKNCPYYDSFQDLSGKSSDKPKDWLNFVEEAPEIPIK